MASLPQGPSEPASAPEAVWLRWGGRLATLVWWLVGICLLLLALYVGISRQLIQNVDHFRPDLVRELSARTGLEIDIGTLEGRWNWLDPILIARDIRLQDDDNGQIAASVEQLRIRLDFLATLARQRLVFAEFEADRVDLRLVQSAGDGAEASAAGSAEGVTGASGWLDLAGQWLSEPYLRMTRVSLDIRDHKGSHRTLDIPAIDLVYRQGRFHASGRVMRPGTTEQLARFALAGRHFFGGDFSGQLYLNLDSGRLFDDLVDRYQWQGFRIRGLDLGGEAWLTFRDGQLQRVNGSIRMPYLQLEREETTLVPLEQVRARFGWQRSDMAANSSAVFGMPPGQLHVQDLQWTWKGETTPLISTRLTTGEGSLDMVADVLPLQPVGDLLEALVPLPDQALKALSDYRPSGYLDQVHLRLQDTTEAEQPFRLSGRLRQVAVQAHNGAPGVQGLNGFLYMDVSSGFVRIDPDSEGLVLGFPQLFRGDWEFASARGTVAWVREGRITRVFADDLGFSYGASTELTGAFDLRLDREGEDNLGMRIGVRNGDAGMLADFVPGKIVNPALYQWLTTAITRGRIEEGLFYGHGQIGHSAPRGSFTSSMWYRFSGVTVQYDERWPELTEASGRVDIHNGRTEVQLTSGQLGGIALTSGLVRVQPGQPVRVEVETRGQVPGSAVPFWLANSPLGEMAGASARKLTFAGQYDLSLKLGLSLDGETAPHVQATVTTEGADISYPDAGLAWRAVTGTLVYDSHDGFSGDPLSASFLGRPVSIVFTVGEDGTPLIRQTGTLVFPAALQQLGLTGEASFGISGQLAYRAESRLSSGSGSRIHIRSSLQGLALDWPDPLGKAPQETMNLEATVEAAAGGGVRVSGQWQERADFDFLWQPDGFGLKLQNLHLGEHVLSQIEIEGQRQAQAWQIRTRSERAVGQILLPDDGSPLQASFDMFRLVRNAGDSQAGASRELLTLEEQLQAFRDLDMGDWPDADVRIADLRLDEASLGQWQFRLRPQPERLQVNAIRGQLGALTLTGNMEWSIASERERTHFTGTISGGALRELDPLLGVKMPLRNDKTHIELDLDWPGRPDHFAMSQLGGSASIRLDDGVILEENSTAQLFRIFNLLNSDTLWRRLKFDFSDLYERGVAFDAISGKASISNGRVTLDPELQIVGPSGAFTLTGTTDMTQRQLDMQLVVVLPLTQNLPLAALLMGAGAPIGGALFVLDKVLGDPLSKLASATYSVTGTWDDPEVELRRVFDSGG